MMNFKKIGILGGTFNPVHIGHLYMAEYIRESLQLNQIVFIPTGVPYMKKATEILSGKQRLEMLELSIQKNPYFSTSDIEISREGNTYTFETLEELHKIYPDTELYFLVGADCLFTIEKWYMPHKIFENCILVAANRNDVSKSELDDKKEYLEKMFQANIILIDLPQIDISSTAIRKNLKTNKSIRYMVTDEVLDYIEKNKLYCGEFND